MEKYNIVFIMTDTQNQSMVGAYGNQKVDTPNLDLLAQNGFRFDQAYTTCPLCTPARSAIFTGIHPQVNGAWANNIAPAKNIAYMGDIFRQIGYRAAYTGKWHLDGSGYFGDGCAEGGFEFEWWYDGQRYAEDLGEIRFSLYKKAKTPYDLETGGFTEEWIWGHRVTNHAIDFLEKVGSQPFLLVVSYDEPHSPYVAPREYWVKFSPDDIPGSPAYNAPLTGKPFIQQLQRSERHKDTPWSDFNRTLTRFFGCNSFIDREIGRVIQAVEQLHPDNTVIIYTSDHGDMMGAHGLVQKGPMMYQPIVNIPLIIKMPGSTKNNIVHSPVSHIDLLPTMLELAGEESPSILQGTSLLPILTQQSDQVRDNAYISFHRFAINHDDWGGFFPIRCITNGKYKLAINLFDLDEFYDLENDPYELNNQINNANLAEIRNELHISLLAEMDRIRDPFRGYQWHERPWHTIGNRFYFGGARRNAPTGFIFQPKGLEAGE